jgi:hypothetical protein
VLLWIHHRYALASICFVLALLSKEPAVVLVPLLVLVTWVETRSWRRVALVAPLALATAVYMFGIFTGQKGNQHFSDGTFSIHAPVLWVWANSFGRLFWVWGLSCLAVLAACRMLRRQWPALRVALVWISITLLPYCFLTYMPRIPSRHTYLASAGLGLVAGAAMLALWERTWLRFRWLPWAFAAAMVLQNSAYVWTRKQAQFEARALPTEALLRYIHTASAPVYVHCFEYGFGAARLVVEVGAGKPASMLIEDSSPPADAAYVFCLGDRHHKPLMRPPMRQVLGQRL